LSGITKMTKKHNSAYIRFLNLINAIDEQGADKRLDAIEEQLLEQVMRSSSQGREILVGDLISLGHIGSQATLHGRVKNLITAGYINPIADASDGRRKKLLPTKLAQQHYENLSMLLIKAATA